MHDKIGFGHDPIFLSQGSDLSFAEMGPPFGRTGKKESKHHVRALEKLIGWLERGMEG